ncbi:MAG TPA: BlaI/MecI/CopY family transcriptional regulator [Candidatus Dorea intestinavium]|nr:BlaI/MecI/CopY family transcriptional regulator [Candidatus Dorea intestinavium]
MKTKRLSNIEIEVMNVFWDTEEPLAATDIPKINPELNVNTVQATVRGLLKKSLIKVADIVYHNTVLTRAYLPEISRDEYWANQLEIEAINKPSFLAALIHQEEDLQLLEKLEELIKEQKEKLLAAK